MYTESIRQIGLHHLDQQRRARLDRRNVREKKQRQINNFQELSDCQLSPPQFDQTNDYQEIPEMESNLFTEKHDVDNAIDSSLLMNGTEAFYEEIDGGLSGCVETGDHSPIDSLSLIEEKDGRSSSDDTSETCEAKTDMRLHDHTNISVLDWCKSLSSFLRKANVNKSHSSSLLHLIKSVLPIPNNMPRSMEDLLSQLDVKDLFFKRSICLLCERNLNQGASQCSWCPSSDQKKIAHVYDLDIVQMVNIMLERLSPEIEDYKKLIMADCDDQKKNDIPFGLLYVRMKRHDVSREFLA
jgi:hypothetical protein